MSETTTLTRFDPMPLGYQQGYKGRMVGEIIEEDPGFVNWMINNTDYRLDDHALNYLNLYLEGS